MNTSSTIEHMALPAHIFRIQIVKCLGHSLTSIPNAIFNNYYQMYITLLVHSIWNWILYIASTFLAVLPLSFLLKGERVFAVQKRENKKFRECSNATATEAAMSLHTNRFVSKLQNKRHIISIIFFFSLFSSGITAIKLFLFAGTSCLRVIQNLCVHGKREANSSMRTQTHTHTNRIKT